MSKRFRVILSIACAFLACLCAVAYANSEKADSEQARTEALKKYGSEITQVVVATRNLDAGESLANTNCEARDWIVDFIPHDAITDMSEAHGAVLTSPVSEGTPITKTALQKSGESLAIPLGYVAMSIALTEKTGITQNVEVGAHLAAYKIQDGATRLLSNEVQVLSTPKTAQGTKDSSITLAVPALHIASVMSAYADSTLKLVQPADDATGLDETEGIDVVKPVPEVASTENNNKENFDGE